MGGTYGTPTAATLTPAFLLRPETRVLLGVGGSTDLETASWPYQVYGASIGLGAGKGIDMGLLADIKFKHAPKIEPVAGVNYQEDTVYELTGEECQVDIGVKEVKTHWLQQAVAAGVLRILGTEALLTFGGGCAITYYPLVIEFTNSGCNAPTSPNIGSGITGGILTLYRTIQIGGLSFDALTAKAEVTIPLSFKVVADTTKAKKNRLGNLYLY